MRSWVILPKETVILFYILIFSMKKNQKRGTALLSLKTWNVYLYSSFLVGVILAYTYPNIKFLLSITILIGIVLFFIHKLPKRKTDYEKEIDSLKEGQKYISKQSEWPYILKVTVDSKDKVVPFDSINLKRLIAGKHFDGNLFSHDSIGKKISWNPKYIKKVLNLFEYIATTSEGTTLEILKSNMEKFFDDYNYHCKEQYLGWPVLERALNEYCPTVMKLLEEKRKI